MKEEVTLYNFKVCKAGNEFYLTGVAELHPLYGRYANIKHTSPIINCTKQTRAKFTCETENRIYKLSLERINTEFDIVDKEYRYDGTTISELYKIYSSLISYKYRENADDSFVNVKLQNLYNSSAIGKNELSNKLFEYNKYLLNTASKYRDCIFIDLYSIGFDNKAAYNICGRTGLVDVEHHNELFNGYIRYSGNTSEKDISFEYYPDSNNLYVISIGKDVMNIAIKNNMKHRIYVNNKTVIEQGNTVIIRNKNLI